LLGNALKYTRDQASPVIEFGQLAPSLRVTASFFVADNGAGFNMAFADKAVQPLSTSAHAQRI